MIELIPAIDIIKGQCVRLTQGDYNARTIYNTNPVEVAKDIERRGFKRLHIVDLDGAKSHHIVNDNILREITQSTNLEVDFGGGIKTQEDIDKVFACGASKVTIGSVAICQPELFTKWLNLYGTHRIILGADVRNGKISINGWKDNSDINLIDFLEQYIRLGVYQILCTDISKDGMLSGPAFDLYAYIMQRYPSLHLIASGGVSSSEDILRLASIGVPAVVFGKALYEGRIDEQKLFMPEGIAKRIIPCLDVRNGQTVKGTNFINLRNAGDPVELGKEYSIAGADELVYLDITATAEGRKTFTDMVTRVASEINIPFTVGGGINQLEDVERLLYAGADKVSINSAAIQRPQLINEIATKFGSQVCVCAIDAQYNGSQWICYTKGGRERTNLSLFDWAKEAQDRGAGEILFTSMNHDGVKDGFAIEALAKLSQSLTIPIIASGGAGKMSHFKDAFIEGKADAALAASVFHFGEISIPTLKQYLNSQHINVRL